VLAFSNNPESNFAECPDGPFSRDIGKEHIKLEPLLHRPSRLLSLRLSYGDMSVWHL
jgi:hypothetical protein